MARNLYRQFLELIPHDPLLVGEVTSHNSDGTSTLQLSGGGTLRARGQGAGGRVWRLGSRHLCRRGR
ncbi:hypothetical protein [Halomonas aquatica]|uniref:Uncharacterized protein n=1 Tax=Halomonas aquatica TaxID=3151123 RepID=A0ABV1NBX7_9GAMM